MAQAEYASERCKPVRLEASSESGIETVVDAVFLDHGAFIRTRVSWRTTSTRAGSRDSPVAVSTEWVPGMVPEDFGLER